MFRWCSPMYSCLREILWSEIRMCYQCMYYKFVCLRRGVCRVSSPYVDVVVICWLAGVWYVISCFSFLLVACLGIQFCLLKGVQCDWLWPGRPRGRSFSPKRVKNFLFSTLPRPNLEPTQPPTQRVSGALSTGVKRPGREPDHSPPASAEFKKMWIYTSTPPYALMA
jgi:hypothetical protein